MTKIQIPTHVPFLDKILGGQFSPGTHGVIIPTGIGKSHLAMMIAINGATHGDPLGRHAQTPRPWVLFNMDMPRGLMHERLLSHAGQIKRSDVFPACDREPDLLQPKRVQVVEVVNRQLLHYGYQKWIDFERSCPSLHGVHLQLSACLLAGSKERGLGGIVIDDAYGVLGLFNSSKPCEIEDYKFLSLLAGTWCREWANKYQCPVWIMHNADGDAGGESPLARLHHRNALWCKTFADKLDVCLVVGTRCLESWVFGIQCTKTIGKPLIKCKVPLMYNPDDVATIIEAEGYTEDPQQQCWTAPTDPALLGTPDVLARLAHLKATMPDRTNAVTTENPKPEVQVSPNDDAVET